MALQDADELFVVMHNLIRRGIVRSRSEPRGGGTSLDQSSCEPNPAADRDRVIAGFNTLISTMYEDKELGVYSADSTSVCLEYFISDDPDLPGNMLKGFYDVLLGRVPLTPRP